MSFHVLDTILFLACRSQVCKMRASWVAYQSFHAATRHLRTALPSATQADIDAYGDTCAICKERLGPGAKVRVNPTACVRPCFPLLPLPSPFSLT